MFTNYGKGLMISSQYHNPTYLSAVNKFYIFNVEPTHFYLKNLYKLNYSAFKANMNSYMKVEKIEQSVKDAIV